MAAMFQSFPTGGNVLIQGASRGIGLEFARQCLAEPRVGHVVATCRTPSSASALAMLATTAAGRLTVLPLDVTDEASISAAARTAAQTVPRLQMVVNCAGVLHDAAAGMRPEKRLADVQPAALARAFAINAIGPLLMARHLEPLLAHDMYTRTLAIEWARSRRNVICVALHPGTTDTELSRPFQANVPEAKLFTVAFAVTAMLGVLDRLQPADTGQFFAWDGERIPW
jgi:NAD(P)-dependent dehydrogenase (short-subunit alcohol dehydrogenase family)